MARFFILWRENPLNAVVSPADPSEALKLQEKIYAGIDDLIKKGLIEEIGVFPDGTTGYAIAKGEATDVFRGVNMFQRYLVYEVCQEIIPYEKSKEVTRKLLKDLIAAAKK